MPKIQYKPEIDGDDRPEPEAPVEIGPWRYGAESKAVESVHRHFLESADFTHDVRLYISGDFVDEAQRQAYGEMLAERLNRACSPKERK